MASVFQADDPQELFAFTERVAEVDVAVVYFTVAVVPVGVPTNVAPPDMVHV